MEATISLRLPRDAASVPVIRQLLNASLGALGVEPQIRDDIQLMLSEACSNVIQHAEPSDDYMVSTELIRDRCVIKVVDAGNGFDSSMARAPSPTSEHGRGLLIMQALADDVRFVNGPSGDRSSAWRRPCGSWTTPPGAHSCSTRSLSSDRESRR